ncbi:MAG: hypothetical protein ABI330_19690 [Caldimonas sp.]|nr:hypothetical protein [Pseudomonadota bacterium]
MNHPVTAPGRKLSLLAAAALAGALASPAVWAQQPAGSTTTMMTPQARYLKDRANCDAGRTAEDRATCLKEAGAALEERKHHTLDNSGSPVANATDRCNSLPDKDKAGCVARVLGPIAPNQRVTTSGSVAGGGVLKETTTTTPGAVIVVVPGPAPQPAPTK